MRRSIPILVVSLVLFCGAHVQAQRITYSIKEITRGVNNPWEMRIGQDGWIYYTERPGRFSKVNPETGEKRVLWTPSDAALDHDAGMMGFDFHPNFPDSPFVYIAYIYYPDKYYKFGLFRLTVNGDSLIDRRLIYGPEAASNSHNGCRIVARDTDLFFSLGDVWWPASAQDTTLGQGKIIRLDLNGKIPDDNPFAHSFGWSIGHRNPQGLDFSPDGKLYSSEHGTDVDDEVNIIQRGRNYGWPRVQGLCDSDSEQAACDSLNVVEPIMKWSPTIAVGDLQYYAQSRIPEWHNSLLLATLKDQSLYALDLDSAGDRVLGVTRYNLEDSAGEPLGRLRSLCTSADGRLFVGTGNGNLALDTVDRIVELTRTGLVPEITRLSRPDDASILEAPIAALSWLSTYPGAVFDLQVATDTSFSDASMVVQTQTRDTAVILDKVHAGGRYYWRVKEVTTSGPWSEIRYFEAVVSSAHREPAVRPNGFDLRRRGRTLVLVSESQFLNARIELLDILGKKLKDFDRIQLANTEEFSLGEVEPGAYFVRIACNGHIQTSGITIGSTK